MELISHDSRGITWITNGGRIATARLDRLDKRPYRSKSDHYHSAAFSPSGKTIFAGDIFGNICILGADLRGERASLTVHGFAGIVQGIISSPTSVQYASRSITLGGIASSSICVWEVNDEGLALATRSDNWNHVELAVFAPDGKSIAAIFSDNDYYLMGKRDALTGRCVLQWKLPGHPAWVEFSSDGRYLATTCTGPRIDLWVWETGKRFKPRLTSRTGEIQGYAFSPDGVYVALCYDKQIYVLDLKKLAMPILFDNAEDISSRALQFSPNGHHVAAVASGNSCITVWEATTGKLHDRIQAENLDEKFSFSPDGQHIAYQARGGIHVWDFLEGESKRRIVYQSRVDCLAFSPLDRDYMTAIIRSFRDPDRHNDARDGFRNCRILLGLCTHERIQA